MTTLSPVVVVVVVGYDARVVNVFARVRRPLVLAIEPVPKPLWNLNLRHVLTKTQWKKLRELVLAERGLVCATCGKVETEARKISAHEEWSYDTTSSPAMARLASIRLSCWLCHAVEHIGFAHELATSGKAPYALDAAIAHFCRINRATRAEFDVHKDAAFAEWHRRNALVWRVDWGDFGAGGDRAGVDGGDGGDGG